MTLFLAKVKRVTSRFLKSKFLRLPTTLFTTTQRDSHLDDTTMGRGKRGAAGSPPAEGPKSKKVKVQAQQPARNPPSASSTYATTAA